MRTHLTLSLLDGESVILERDGNTPATSMEFPRLANGRTDDDRHTDHRAVFTFNEETQEEATEELRAQIAVIRDLLRQLEEQLRAIETSGGRRCVS